VVRVSAKGNRIVASNSAIQIRPTKDIILFTGTQESGKSYAAKEYIKKLKRVIIWDYNWEYTKREVTLICHSIKEVVWGIKLGHKKIAFQPQQLTETELESLCRTTIEHFRCSTLVIEEIALFQLTNTKYIAGNMPSLKAIFDTGRHERLRIGLFITSRRCIGIPPDITYNAMHMFIFQQDRPNDVKYIQEQIGTDLVEKLDYFPPFYFVHYQRTPKKTEIHKPL